MVTQFINSMCDWMKMTVSRWVMTGMIVPSFPAGEEIGDVG